MQALGTNGLLGFGRDAGSDGSILPYCLIAEGLSVKGKGGVQAQHHMKQQLYVGSLAVNHSVEGPIPDPVALPAGRCPLELATCYTCLALAFPSL